MRKDPIYKEDLTVISLQTPINKTANNIKQILLTFWEYLISNTAIQEGLHIPPS